MPSSHPEVPCKEVVQEAQDRGPVHRARQEIEQGPGEQDYQFAAED